MEESHKTHRPHIKVGKDEEKKIEDQNILHSQFVEHVIVSAHIKAVFDF